MTVWKCALYDVAHLANTVVHCPDSKTLEVTVDDLDLKRKFIIRFSDLLGYRFQSSFHTKYVGNTFIVSNSCWLKAIPREPLFSQNIDTAKHYLISTMDGELEVLSLLEPHIKELKASRRKIRKAEKKQ